MMNFYKLIISYDGTNYQGWQEQTEFVGIANVLKKKFIKLFNHNISIVGASRTDAGVHAMAQVARIITDLTIDPQKLKHAWNNSLPEDIVITSIEVCNDSFHPLKNVKQKIYYYHFFQERPLPFSSRYGCYFYWPVDIQKLEQCLKIFIGKHDFRSFSTGDEMNSTIRTIDDISLEYVSELKSYRIVIKGKSFLHHMIRRIVGACLDVSSRKDIEIEFLKEALEKKNPNQALPNAQAKGLMLYSIEYY